MQYEERQGLILERLASQGSVRVSDLRDLCHVSDMTIRRDLETLEQQGLLKRTHGGAVAAVSGSYEPPFASRALAAQEAKTRIGELAASRIRDGDTVILDVGSTSLAVARALRQRSQLTVLTPSLRIATELADSPGIRLMMTGGSIRPGELSLVGPLAEAAFEGLIFDHFVMGVGGIHPTAGVTEYNLDDARVKQRALESAQSRMVVADRSKIGKVAFARVCPLTEIDVVVTEDRPDVAIEDIEALQDTVEVMLA